MEIRKERNRLTLFNDKQQEVGEMAWSDTGLDIIIIDHTFVGPVYHDQKLAERLVYTGVELARHEGKKVALLCPYTEKEPEKKPGYHDVLRQSQ